MTLDPLHFLASTDSQRRSRAVACWRDNALIGIVYVTEQVVAGLGMGYAIGGDYAGRGLVLCEPKDKSVVLMEAATVC